MIRIIITALAVFASLIAAAQNMGQMSTMREQMQYYNQLGFTTDAQFDSLHATIPNSVTYPRAACNLNKVVYGWHPYWVGSVYTNYDWSMLSDLCYFSYELNAADGNATSTHSFSTAAVVDEALSQGTRVHLCVTLFSNHGTFLTNATAKQTLITNLINMVGARGGHGVNIDFEGVSSTYKVEFRDFMNDLSDQFHAAIPGSIVSMALPSVDWSTAYEVENMTSVDLFIIMGYDYYYSGSTTAGPNDPLYNYTTGYAYCLTRSVAYYLNKVPAAKLTLGLPYYTRRYETASAALPGSVTGSSAVVMFKDYLTNASGYYDNTLWSSDAFITYYVFQIAGQWNQCFIDDPYSMGRRYDLVNQAGLAGIGIWALGYDDGHPDYWNLIRDKFSDCAVVECTDSVFDTGGPNRNYFNNENFPITIAPTNATGLSLQFTSFATENNFDTLFIYDGPTVASPLLGRYTGTNSP
ncbi:MAG: hypothetical protein KKD31_16065, partial [Bacteroidetes bacterium]|nr:hypothetical protein [Bacteroidota bacterium]